MNDDIVATTRLRVGEAVHARPIDDIFVLLDLRAGNYFGLDEVGALVWQKVRDGMSIGEIAEDLAGEFPVEKEVLVRDIVAFASELVARGLCIPDVPFPR